MRDVSRFKQCDAKTHGFDTFELIPWLDKEFLFCDRRSSGTGLHGAISIFPRGEKPNPGREKIAAVNELISKFAGGAVRYMDIGEKFLEADKSISKEVMHDHLHLAPKGYDIWAEVVGGKAKEIET